MINILLSTYNGERFVREQIDSVLNQTQEGCSLFVRDDGSSDGTKDILLEYGKTINCVFSENIGCGKSFWELLRASGDSDYYAFCDQDDVWDNDKIETAIRHLKNEDNQLPLLYCCRYKSVDKDLKLIKDYGSDGISFPSFKRCFIYSIAAGCTFVMNRKARDLLIRFNKENLDIHDWTATKIISLFGKIIFDSSSHINYRQHGNNAIGDKRGIRHLFHRFLRIKRSNNVRSEMAKKILETYGNDISEEKKESLALLANYRDIRKGWIKLFNEFKPETKGFERIVFFYLAMRKYI